MWVGSGQAGQRRVQLIEGPESLVSDFSKFQFLLGATDGEGIFTPGEQ